MGWCGVVVVVLVASSCPTVGATEGGGGIKKGNEPLQAVGQAWLLLGTVSYGIPQNRKYVYNIE